MKNKGVFTLSLDCEGLWGMADQPSLLASDIINGQSLQFAYEFLSNVLNLHDVRATAAFVSAFAAPRAALLEHLPLIERLSELNPGWFMQILPMLRQGENQGSDGWQGEAFWRNLAASGHEMAWHGATHMPLDNVTTTEAVDLELLLAEELFDALNHTPSSVVFPRNQVGHLDRLRQSGFLTYRASNGSGGASRVVALLRELYVWDNAVADKPREQDGLYVSPPGFFLNWPAGIRSAVPVSVTVRRWRSLLRHAAETGGYVHMWFHPHNFITAPAMQETFALIMHEVGILVRTGDLLNLTMDEANTHYNLKAVT